MDDNTCPHATEESVRQQLLYLGMRIDEVINGDNPDGTGFLLLVSYGDTANMVSNMDPQDLKVALKLQLARLEGQPEMYGHA